LSFILVLAFAASAFATTWVASGPYYASGTGVAVANGEYLTKSTTAWEQSATIVGGSTLDLSLLLHGSWDSKYDTTNTNSKEWDYFAVNIYSDAAQTNLVGSYRSDVNALESMMFDNANGKKDGAIYNLPVNISINLPFTDGVYYFKAWGEVTKGGTSATDNTVEYWSLVSANVTPTPLPAAVWMLGSGLLGFMGFKRTRKTIA